MPLNILKRAASYTQSSGSELLARAIKHLRGVIKLYRKWLKQAFSISSHPLDQMLASVFLAFAAFPLFYVFVATFLVGLTRWAFQGVRYSVGR